MYVNILGSWLHPLSVFAQNQSSNAKQRCGVYNHWRCAANQKLSVYLKEVCAQWMDCVQLSSFKGLGKTSHTPAVQCVNVFL